MDDPLRLRAKKSGSVSAGAATRAGLNDRRHIRTQRAQGRVPRPRESMARPIQARIRRPRPHRRPTARCGSHAAARRGARGTSARAARCDAACGRQRCSCGSLRSVSSAAAGTGAQRGRAARQMGKRAWEQRAVRRPVRGLQRASPAAPPLGGRSQAPAWRTGRGGARCLLGHEQTRRDDAAWLPPRLRRARRAVIVSCAPSPRRLICHVVIARAVRGGAPAADRSAFGRSCADRPVRFSTRAC